MAARITRLLPQIAYRLYLGTMAPVKIRLRELRRERKLTQVQLAERCGMPQSTISRIESGSTTGVDFETLDRIAHALEVHPSLMIAFDRVTFDLGGRSYVVNDVTATSDDVGADTAQWAIEGTPITFAMSATATPALVIRKAKSLLR